MPDWSFLPTYFRGMSSHDYKPANKVTATRDRFWMFRPRSGPVPSTAVKPRRRLRPPSPKATRSAAHTIDPPEITRTLRFQAELGGQARCLQLLNRIY